MKALPYAEEPQLPDISDIYILAIPMATYRALSEEAARRNLSFAALLQRAFESVLQDQGGSHGPS